MGARTGSAGRGVRRRAGLLGFGLVAAAFAVGASTAAALELRLSLSQQEVSVGEQFTVSVEVRHQGMGSVPEAELPPVENVRRISSYSSQSFSYVNGKATSSVIIRYVMVADEKGTYTIGPASASRGREHALSNTVTLKVVAPGQCVTLPRGVGRVGGAPSSAGGKDIVVLAKVDNDHPFVNEQITYTFTLLRRVRILEGSRTPPPMTGFWAEDLDTTEPTEVVVEGRRYVAERVRTALFPTGPGEFTIGPTTLNATVEDRRRRRRDPFDLFGGDPFGLFPTGREIILRTDPITVRVRPLPEEGKPSGFSGAVGRFVLESEVDRHRVKAGEPLTLRVTLSGEGNVKVVPAPDLSVLEGFKVYESTSEESSTPRDGKILGKKTWEYLLVPTSGGELVIPPVRMSVFDPRRGEYVLLATPAVPLEVEATDLDEALARGDDLGVAKERVRLRQRDIRYVKPVPEVLRTRGRAPYARAGFLLAHAFPVLAVAGSALVRRRREKLRSDVRYARARRAARVAARRLAESGRALEEGRLEEFFANLSAALRGYVADKLHLAAANLDEAEVRRGLAELGVGAEELGALFGMLGACDSARFSPLGGDSEGARRLREEARKWIERVERE